MADPTTREAWDKSVADFRAAVEGADAPGVTTGTAALVALVVIWLLTEAGHSALKKRGY
jgi:hypothetical protein